MSLEVMLMSTYRTKEWPALKIAVLFFFFVADLDFKKQPKTNFACVPQGSSSSAA